MKLNIEKPTNCGDCVFGQEGGFSCALRDGELCNTGEDCMKKPEWCPFDGGTITREDVLVLP